MTQRAVAAIITSMLLTACSSTASKPQSASPSATRSRASTALSPAVPDGASPSTERENAGLRKCDDQIVDYLTTFFLDLQTDTPDDVAKRVRSKFGAHSRPYRAFREVTTNPHLLSMFRNDPNPDFNEVAKATYTACNRL